MDKSNCAVFSSMFAVYHFARIVKKKKLDLQIVRAYFLQGHGDLRLVDSSVSSYSSH